MAFTPTVAVAPFVVDGLLDAISTGGGRPGEASDADALVWTNPGDPKALAELLRSASVRWVQLPFAGIESFFEAGVIDPLLTWTCTKGIYGPACAEHALALMFAAARRINVHARARTWVNPGLGSPERMLKGSTVLVFGTGGIGSALVPLLRPLGVRIVAVNRSGRPLDGAERTVTTEHLGDVIGEADFVVVTAALTDETRGLFDAPMLARMKDGACLVNVARGGLVRTDDLVAEVATGRIGAALDVTDPEPLPDDHPLWTFDNVIVTPHIANTWDMALPELSDMVRRNVGHFASGEPLEGLVDPELGY